MKRFSMVVLVCMFFVGNCLGEDIKPVQIEQVKEIIENIHGYSSPKKIDNVAEEIKKLGKGGEQILISMFKDKRDENLEWRMEAGIILLAIKSEEGTNLVRKFMEEFIAAYPPTHNFTDEEMIKFDKALDRMGILSNIEGTNGYLDQFLVRLDNIFIFKNFVYTYGVPNGIETLIKQKPEEFIPITIDAIEGKEFKGRRPVDNTRINLLRAIVIMKTQLDEKTKIRVWKAIKKFQAEKPKGYEKELEKFLKEFK